MLKQRVITALILIPLTVGLLFYLPPPAFCVLTGLIILMGAWEWSALAGIQRPFWRVIYLLVVITMFFMVLAVPAPLVLMLSFFWWLFAAGLVMLYPQGSGVWGKSGVVRAVMGLFVLLPCWTALNYMRMQRDGIYALLFLFVLIWGADSAAYFVGKQFGKNHLAPLVSPGKTWEGATGAMLFTFIVTVAVLWLCKTPFIVWPWALALSWITVAFSMLGDLFESMIKRLAGVKDSGRLLPGHGGLLDRIDSLTAAAPIFALGAFLLGQFLA